MSRRTIRVLQVASRSTIQRSQFLLDAALLVFLRSRTTGPVVRFGHADSSPIAGYDWLWTEYPKCGRGSAYPSLHLLSSSSPCFSCSSFAHRHPTVPQYSPPYTTLASTLAFFLLPLFFAVFFANNPDHINSSLYVQLIIKV